MQSPETGQQSRHLCEKCQPFCICRPAPDEIGKVLLARLPHRLPNSPGRLRHTVYGKRLMVREERGGAGPVGA